MFEGKYHRSLWIVASGLVLAVVTVGWLQLRFIDRLHATEMKNRGSEVEAGLEAFRQAFDVQVFGWQLVLQRAAAGLGHDPELLDSAGLIAARQRSDFESLWAGAFYREPGDTGSWWSLEEKSFERLELDDPRPQALQPALDSGTSLPYALSESHLTLKVQIGPVTDLLAMDLDAVPAHLASQGSLVVVLDRQHVNKYFLEPLMRVHLRYAGKTYDYLLAAEQKAIEGGVEEASEITIFASAAGLIVDKSKPSERDQSHNLTSKLEIELLSSTSQAAILFSHTERESDEEQKTENCDSETPGANSECETAVPPALVFRTADSEGLWTLSAHPRAEAFSQVNALRVRNLLLSLASLGILAASLGLLSFLALRGERLARSQLAFVAGVSHDLRTPLSVIQQAAANLADGVVYEPEAVRSYGDMVRAEGKKLQEMIERILTYAGLGTQPLPLEALEIAPLVEKVLGEMHTEIEARKVTMETTHAETLPTVRANRAALESAIRNLLSNALKYGASGGRVMISTAEAISRKEVQLTVRDWGPGIEAADRRHLFEPFFRGHAVRETHEPGTGIGLSLVARVAETLGGRVSFESPPDGGCAFVLHLPAASPEAV